MEPRNRLGRIAGRLAFLPERLRRLAVTQVVRKTVPFTDTACLTVEELTGERVTVFLENRRRVRNHIGGLHAAAMTLAAETCSGFVVAMNVPDSRLPLMKSLKVEFKKRCQGGLRATATLTAEQLEQIRTLEKGEVEVAVAAVDASGAEPIRCQMIWAWVPKKK
jgi:acyl-coenzyme A thioesterase PaaI-like protein